MWKIKEEEARYLPFFFLSLPYEYVTHIHAQVMVIVKLYVIQCSIVHVHTHALTLCAPISTQYQVQEASLREQAAQKRARAIDEQK